MAEVEEREALLGIAIGKKGVGKTYATLELIQRVLKGNPKTGAKPRKVLILDVNNEFGNVKKDFKNPAFEDIKAIRLEDVRKFTFHPKIEARRVTVFKEGGGKMTLVEIGVALGYILENFQNGTLLIEDINKFVSNNIKTDLIGAIITQRHLSVDLIIHYQSIGKAATPQLWANCNWLRFHKCEDTVQRHESKFAGDVTHLKLIEKMVNMEYKKGNIRFYAYLNKDNGKIQGQFSLTTFKDAIEAYLQENPEIMQREYKKADIYSGQPIHKSRAAAGNYLMQEYITDFYGNPK